MRILGFIFSRLLCFRRKKLKKYKFDDDDELMNAAYKKSTGIPVPLCRVTGCGYFGAARFGGFCSVCYRKHLAFLISKKCKLGSSKIAMPVAGVGLPLNYRRRYVSGLALRSSRDLMARHDALIAELNQKIKVHHDISPSMVSSSSNPTTANQRKGSIATTCTNAEDAEDESEGSEVLVTNLRPIGVANHSNDVQPMDALKNCVFVGKKIDTRLLNEKKATQVALPQKTIHVNIKRRPK